MAYMLVHWLKTHSDTAFLIDKITSKLIYTRYFLVLEKHLKCEFAFILYLFLSPGQKYSTYVFAFGCIQMAIEIPWLHWNDTTELLHDARETTVYCFLFFFHIGIVEYFSAILPTKIIFINKCKQWVI